MLTFELPGVEVIVDSVRQDVPMTMEPICYRTAVDTDASDQHFHLHPLNANVKKFGTASAPPY